MAQRERFRIGPFTNPSGVVVYRVTGRKLDGTQVRENFPDYGRAVARKQELEQDALQIENSVTLKATRLSQAELAQAEAAINRLQAAGHSLDFAVNWFLAHWRPPTPSPTVETAYQQFLAEKTAQNLRPRSIQDYRSRVGALVKLHPKQKVDEITSENLRALIYRDEVGPLGKNGDRRALFSFFEWCVLMGHCPSNPVKKVARTLVERKTPRILSLAEVERLLTVARDHNNGAALPYIALWLFGGLRPNELMELQVVDLTGKAITVDACIAKLRARRVVEDLDTAIFWLLPFQGSPIAGPTFRRDFDAVRRMAGFRASRFKKGDDTLTPWTPDILRHTALSFHFAKYKDENRTSSWAGNSPDVLHKHYRGLVRADDAERYWAMRPDNVNSKIVPLPAVA